MQPTRIFVSYSHDDMVYKDQMLSCFKPLIKNGRFHIWHDGEIRAGEILRDVIMRNLNACHIFLPLVSASFLSSDFIMTQEVPRALERKEEEGIKVLPIILRPCLWAYTSLGKMLVLPKDGKPLSQHSDKEEAWLQVLEGIVKATQGDVGAVPDRRSPPK